MSNPETLEQLDRLEYEIARCAEAFMLAAAKAAKKGFQINHVGRFHPRDGMPAWEATAKSLSDWSHHQHGGGLTAEGALRDLAQALDYEDDLDEPPLAPAAGTTA